MKEELKKLFLKFVFAASAMTVLVQQNNYILKSGLPVVKAKPKEETKPKTTLKTTLLKIGFAAASLIALATTSSAALNPGLEPVDENTNNTKKELKSSEEVGTKMYVYGSEDPKNIPAGLICWTGYGGASGENIYLSFNSLSENFNNDHNLTPLGSLQVPMFYMMDILEPGKAPTYYVSSNPNDGGKVLGPVATLDAEIYIIKDNLTGKYFVVSYDDIEQIRKNPGVRYTVIGVCDRAMATKYGCGLKSSTPYQDFAQNTVISAFLPETNKEINKM